MIYVTGDIHGSIDIKKLGKTSFTEEENMTKDDFVICTGDFGLVWSSDAEEMYWRDWLHKKKFTTLFVDGNHENFDMLNSMEVKMWNGGKVHFINSSIIHLMRGQVYMINGLKFFTMGGATSIDRHLRKEGKSWWPQEMPTKEEFDEALNNLDRHNLQVDCVITHATSTNIMRQLCYIKENNPLNRFFDMLEEDLKYRHWYFGHFHDDIDINEKHTLLYERIIKII